MSRYSNHAHHIIRRETDKIAAYRMASSGEETMSELISSVQTREHYSHLFADQYTTQLWLHCKSPFLYLTLISTQLEVNVHQVDPSTGGFNAESQETLFVPYGEFEKADKTLGWDTIQCPHSYPPCAFSVHLPVYFIGSLTFTGGPAQHGWIPSTATLAILSFSPTSKARERTMGLDMMSFHLAGNILYSVTEHSSTSPFFSRHYRSTHLTLPPADVYLL